MQDGLLLVGGTLCQCVNDPGEDDWCWWWLVVVCRSRARHEEEACPRCVSWSHCSAFTLPRPWRRSMIMATRRPSEQLSWSKCPHPGMSRAILSQEWWHLIYLYSDAIVKCPHLYKLASSFNRDVQCLLNAI